MPSDDYTVAYDQLRELLKKSRESEGLSQAKLAEKLNVPQSYVSKYETGERRLDIVETLEICAALGVDGPTFIREFQTCVGNKRRKRTR